ncbi:g2945 [Coccomyxa viridis]|uniref:G2945 protein n=1 Tax=Coccomyxa viridis TaxID=1274662 RepID=A0ABP1FQM2_9CHLO
MSSAEKAAGPEVSPTALEDEIANKAKWPEVHGLAAPIWKTAMRRPVQSLAPATYQVSRPGAAVPAMQRLALGDGILKGQAPSLRKTQVENSFASEDDDSEYESSEASSECGRDCPRILEGFNDAFATWESSQALNSGNSACTGGAVKRALPEKVLQEVWSLGAAEEHDTGITDLLEEAGCKDEIKMLQEDCLDKVHSSSVLTGLQEAAEKGVATMRGTCAEHGLEKEVASVYKALEEALRLADESGNDLKLL